jgi:hypothetical protein
VRQPGGNLVSGSRMARCILGKFMLSKCTFGNVMINRWRESRKAHYGRSMTCEATDGKIMLSGRQGIH